jgi:HSP20 family molecular chaperone IbpA
MVTRDRQTGLFADAVELLRQADRMHRQFFGLAPAREAGPCWEPPVDVIESDRTLAIRVALPGAAPGTVEVTTDGASLTVKARRPLEARHGDAIHRLEIPYGRFERRIDLPTGRFELTSRDMVDGCLVITLERLA